MTDAVARRRLTTIVDNAHGLRAAVENASIGHVVIAAGQYVLESELQITRNVTVQAEIAGAVVLDASGASRVIKIDASASAAIALVGLNITGGHVSYPHNGGGIFISGGHVDLQQLSVYSNTVEVRSPTARVVERA